MNKKHFQLYQKKKHLIFDLDETIVTLKIDWNDWDGKIAEILKEFDKNYVYKKENTSSLLVSFIKKYGRKIQNKIIKFQNQYEKEKLKGYIVNNQLVNYIEKNTHQKNYLITNNTKKTALPILNELAIKNRFEKIITVNDVFYPKPHPEGILKIIDKKIPLSDYIVIGDSENDEKIAQITGVDFIKIVFKA